MIKCQQLLAFEYLLALKCFITSKPGIRLLEDLLPSSLSQAAHASFI